MEWIFLVTASARPRVESRLLQVLEQRLVPLKSFASVRTIEETHIRIVAGLDSAAAARIADLLRKIADVTCVQHAQQPPAASRAAAGISETPVEALAS